MDDSLLQWDAKNAAYIGSKESRGLTPGIVNEVHANRPRFFEEGRPGRSASHHMIGPANDGRMWTVGVLQVGEKLWRPITGWPSTNPEIRRYIAGGNQ